MAAVLSESVLDQNGQNDHFGQNDFIPNWILAFARPEWSIVVHFGLERSILVHLGRSANRTLATPDPQNRQSAPRVQNWGGAQFAFFLCSDNSHTPPPPPNLDGPNRPSPIASVQRTRSTLAGHSAGLRGTNTIPTNANRAIRIAVQRTQGQRGPNSVF